uniref:hypothetical protein n=1 Tax=Altererythrobacter segetis TaxID=1104773 RepID=UPI0014076158|nr:hypothetical protein [Altererythrobacter segetis]
MSDQAGLKRHDLASAEIDGWRGRCLDIFARGERAVSLALEAARAKDGTLKIKHLAGQRMSDLAEIVSAEKATLKQTRAIQTALESWAQVEGRRAYFAHGVVTVLLNEQGIWHVQLDFAAYRSSRVEDHRWNLSRSEADAFEAQLIEAFAELSRELGQLKKRLSA